MSEQGEDWAKELIDLLLEIKNAKDETLQVNKTALASDILKQFDKK